MYKYVACLYGAIILLFYILLEWIPTSCSTGMNHSSQYENSNYSMDDDISITLETRRRFQRSGITSFLSIFEEIIQPRANKIVLVYFVGQLGGCGGIGDRIRGIPYAVALAHLSGRQLILHPSLLENGHLAENSILKSHHHFIDYGCTKENVEKLMKSDAEIISISVNCYPLDPSLFSLQHSQLIELQTIFEECSISYLCGAAAIHHVEVFKDGLNVARRLIDAMPMWQYRNYTVLHIRAGGSNLTIDNKYTTKAVGWEDGYASDIPQHWIDVFKESASSMQCDKHLTIISDSVRLVSELQFEAGDWLMLTRCCSQPLHRDRSRRQEFFLQEIIDLFIMARSQKIIAGYGGFAMLGCYWLGRDGPEMQVVASKKEIRSQMEMIRRESDCKTKN